MVRRLLWLWLALAVLSNLWRGLNPSEVEPAPGQRLVHLAERDGDTLTGRRIAIAFREYGRRDATPVLLLHGTPVAGRALERLATGLADKHFVLVPDLPGFGRSAQPLPDYSSLTHAAYMEELLDELDVASAHVIAYSQGGAPGITLAHDAPERVRSLTLLAAIGVQELELFGAYTINHAVYAGQLALVTGSRWLLPHFGWLDNAILGRGYARNLTDTDQRLLRPLLGALRPPTLIVHGRDDGLVPYAAAIEHHRLVAHSELVTVQGGHEIGYATPEVALPAITAFLQRAENGTAPTRADASADRIKAAALPFDSAQRDPLSGFPLVVLVLAIVVATYISEDLTCIAAGLMVAQGILSFPLAVAACLIGLFTSDVALFYVGRWFGTPAVRRLISASAMTRATHWLRRRGPLVIVLSRFTPGTRLPTYLAAGALRMPARTFIPFFAVATAIWTPILVGLAAAYGRLAEQWFERYASLALWLFAGGALALWLAFRVVPPLVTRRGRRLALGRWRRWTRFEYWPRSVFYAPVIAYNLWLALRYRSLTLFALANPGIPGGGLTGESKSAILNALGPSGAVADFIVVDAADKDDAVARIDTFAANEGGGYPLILKPDVGERGRGVRRVHGRADLREHVANCEGRLIAQRCIEGEEFGVLYCRLPGAATGTLTSIAHKGFTTVVGDGQRTLEQLILDDDRAVNMAPHFLDALAMRLDEVPGPGQSVALNAIGTHSRGSIFTDARSLGTEALRAEMDRIARTFDGFHLGRFDLFAPDREALSRGERLRVVELNGLTSEPAHIYQPGSRWIDAVRATCAHWRHAWQIGAALRAAGHRPPGALAVLKLLRSPAIQH